MSKAIAYILNPEKTDEKLLVSSYGCASETAAREFEWTRKIAEQKGMNPVRIIARHVIQSFEIGEVTPELAHEIGKQFADEILGGKYEYVLTTHIDKDHVHNHLIFNAVDFVDYHAYKSYKRIYYDMREVSDRLCKENGLSVIPPSQNKGMGCADQLGDALVLHESGQHLELLCFVLRDLKHPVLRNNGQIVIPPLSIPLIVGAGVCQLHQMTEAPRNDVIAALHVAVLSGRCAQHLCDGLGNAGLFSND